MNCDKIREQLMEVAPGEGLKSKPEAATHLASCPECAKVWSALQKTMLLMDEWQAPEVSPFFNARFQARFAELKREETARPAWSTWMQRYIFGMPVWRPVLAGALAVVTVVSVGVMNRSGQDVPQQNNVNVAVQAPASAVHDLQTLDKDEELYSDLDLMETPDTSSTSAPAGADL